MLYDSYHKKISRVVDTLRKIFKHIVLISIVTVLVIAAIIAFMVTKGIVIDDESDADGFEVTYGDALPLNSKAILARVVYEYSSNGTDWSAEPPKSLGEHSVRATAKTLFGQTKYGKTYSFVLKARSANVSVTDKEIVYGATPSVFAELASGDTLACKSFVYADRLATVTDVAPNKESIKIENSHGEDVTALYNIIPVSTQITVLPRPILVTVSDKELIYNDTRLSYDGYELSGGTLAEGDTLQAVFDKYLIDVGEIENTPTLSVISSDSLDVSVHYIISTHIGTLKVDYRPLIIETPSAEKVYDDTALSNPDYKIIGEYDIVDGHIAECVSSTSITDVDFVENVLAIEIKNSVGEDKTHNYSLFYERGWLEVTPRPVTISSESGKWMYDGQEHYADIHMEGFIAGHSVTASWPTVIDVGVEENTVEVKSVRNAEGKDVLNNYELIFGDIGTVEVTKRPITVTHENGPDNLVYDGTERVFKNYNITSGSLAENDTLELTFPSFSQAGRYENENKILTAKIYSKRSTGIKSLDAYRNYEITEVYGTVEIEKCKIALKVLDNSKEYDGLEFSDLEYEILEGEIPAGHTLNVVYKHVTSNVGVHDAEVDLDKTTVVYAGEDATANFEISAAPGVITILPRKLVLQSASGQKPYDGEDFVLPEYEIITGELIEGHRISDIKFTLKEIVGATDAGIVGRWENIIVDGSVVIVDANEVNMTENYDVQCVNGILEVLLRKLSVSSNSETKLYDKKPLRGTELTIDPISDMNDGLLEGHSIVYSLPVSVINAGIYDNEIHELDILDERGESVKQYYEVTQNIGELEILPIEITVTTASKSKTYDGSPLVYLSYTSDYLEKLLEGHSASIEAIGTITDVGSIPNAVEIKIFDENGEDITAIGNYKIIENYGTLTVEPRVIRVKPLPDETIKLYDGLPLECINYIDISDSANDEGLIGNHRIIEINFESITDAGTIDIKPDSLKPAVIYDGDLRVDHNYEIVVDGEYTLTVQKRSIIVESASAKKEYDGRPLRASDCSISVNSEHTLLDGHTLDIVAHGSQTEEGKSSNKMNNDAKILDGNGIDYSRNYDIKYVEGTLEVYKVVVANIQSTEGGRIYLKTKSYGDYNGDSFGPAPAAGRSFRYNYGGTYHTCSFMLWSSINLLKSNYTENYIRISNATTYMLPYYMTFGGNYDMPLYNSEDYTTLSNKTDYSLYYYNYNYALEGTSGLSRYTPSGYSRYTTWVYDNYLNVPNDTMSALLALVSDIDFSDMTTDERISAIAAFVKNTAVYDTNYDESLDSSEDIAVEFLTTYKVGSSKHFAIATTMLYRALGVPARYVEGYIVDAVANQKTEVKDKYHWVEVFVDSYGWMQIEVALDEKIDIFVKPEDDSKIYDGTPLTATNAELYGASEELKKLFEDNGYKIEGTYSGEIIDVGSISSGITDVRILDANGNNITYRFNVNTRTGILKITPATIDISVFNIYRPYDGKPARYDEDNFFSVKSEDFIKSGLQLKLVETFSEVNVHELSATAINKSIGSYFDFSVTNDKGDDISRNFRLRLVSPSDKLSLDDYIVVRITPRVIELTTGSSETPYIEGAVLENNKVYVSLGPLAEGDVLKAKAIGQLNYIGKTDNPIDLESLKIVNANEEDVTGNYHITIRHGTLTFTE